MIQVLLTTQVSIIFHMHMENYSLTWLESKHNLKVDTEGNPTDIPQVEYQDYLNKKKTYSKMTRKSIQPISYT